MWKRIQIQGFQQKVVYSNFAACAQACHWKKRSRHFRAAIYVVIIYLLFNNIYIYICGYWVVSGPHGTAFINCTCMFEGSYIYLPSTHIYQRHS